MRVVKAVAVGCVGAQCVVIGLYEGASEELVLVLWGIGLHSFVN